jgi:hypothetical protein
MLVMVPEYVPKLDRKGKEVPTRAKQINGAICLDKSKAVPLCPVCSRVHRCNGTTWPPDCKVPIVTMEVVGIEGG